MRFAAALLLSILLFSCAPDATDQQITDPGRTIVPRGGNGIVLASETSASVTGDSAATTPDLRVRLPDSYLPSQVYTINLDLDDTEEQIIIFKRRGDAEDLIRILIVSYDPIRNNWIRAWDGATKATNVRSFTLYTDDLVGDHEQEIVCFGINNAGEQTLDVFRRTSNALGLGLAYQSILSVAADVNITIEELERSAAFEAMETTSAQSYPVVVERRDPAELSAFDTIQTIYLWSFDERAYVAAFEEKISGDTVQDSQLRVLFEGTEKDFESFLSGPWYRTTESSDDILIAFFGTSERTIVFHNSRLHLQQAFTWDDSAKTVYGRGVQLFVTNEILVSLKRLISVSVQDLNRISLVVQDSDGLNGTYERLSGSLQEAVLDRDRNVAAISDFQPRGLYSSSAGVVIVFGSPEFTYREDAEVRTGGYVLYTLGTDLVLELKFVDENRLPVESRRFAVLLEQYQDDDRLIRRMLLQPGYVGLSGFESSSEDPLTLEQIEVLEEVPG